MGKIFALRLPSGRVYCCNVCNVDIAFADDCISKVRSDARVLLLL